MLHKRFIFVSLLAPSLSFASTATESLSGVTRDVFDNLSENPALVNVEGGKNYLRIGKEGGAQSIMGVDGFGLGVQVNTMKEVLMTSESADAYNMDALKIAQSKLSTAGMPLQFTLGGVANGIKWGLGLQYENAKATGLVSSDDKKSVVVDPSYMMTGYRAGLVRDELEVSAGWSRATWKVGTDGTLKAGGADAKIGLLDGASQQMNDALDVTVRYQAKAAQWFVAFEQSKSKLTLWDNTANAANGVAGTSTDRDEFMKGQTISFGAENSQSINENVKHFMKSWFTYLKSTENLNKQKTEVTDMSLSTAHGFEAGLSSWATLRGGVQSTFWGSMSHKITDFAADNQGGTSDTNEVKASNMLRAVAYPTLGMGFKFGAYTIDATFAQDNTGSIGFTDKILGKVEVTAQF